MLLAGSEDFSAWMWNAETGIMMQVRPLSWSVQGLGAGPEQMPASVRSPRC